MIESLYHPETWVAFFTLASLEIVLGIDNLVFIAIMVNRVEESKRRFAYRIGLAGALITRLLLLFAISWVMGLTEDLITIAGNGFSGRDLILLFGGLFLLAKSSHEIYEKMEDPHHGHREGEGVAGRASSTLAVVIVQIMLVDIVFSLDSVITAVGMADELWVMVAAMITAVTVMLIFAERVGTFVNNHPGMQVLALSFLILIGVLLVAEGFGQHINKGYIYFAMGFSFIVQLLSMRAERLHAPVGLHGSQLPEDSPVALGGVGEQATEPTEQPAT